MNLISKELLLSYGGKKCHARVLGILADFGMSQNYVVDIQRAVEFDKPIKRKRNQYQADPDLVFQTRNNSLIIVEYESIDAGIGLFPKKMKYFSLYGPEDEKIDGYIFLTTIFSEKVVDPVKGLPSWAKEKSRRRTEIEECIENNARKITTKKDLFFLYGRFDEKGLRFRLFQDGRKKRVELKSFSW